jgi:hypothetical protein
MPEKTYEQVSAERDKGGREKIESAYGCVVMGRPSEYDGSDVATTQTVFVYNSESDYRSALSQGAKEISKDDALNLWAEPVENNMTQFESH